MKSIWPEFLTVVRFLIDSVMQRQKKKESASIFAFWLILFRDERTDHMKWRSPDFSTALSEGLARKPTFLHSNWLRCFSSYRVAASFLFSGRSYNSEIVFTIHLFHCIKSGFGHSGALPEYWKVICMFTFSLCGKYAQNSTSLSPNSHFLVPLKIEQSGKSLNRALLQPHTRGGKGVGWINQWKSMLFSDTFGACFTITTPGQFTTRGADVLFASYSLRN